MVVCGCVSCRSCSWFLPRLLCLLAFVCAAGSCFCLGFCLLPFALCFSFLSAFCLGIGIDSGCGRINDLARGACGVLLDSSSSSQQRQQPSNRNNNTHSHTYTERGRKKVTQHCLRCPRSLCAQANCDSCFWAPRPRPRPPLSSVSCLPRLASSVLV